MVGDGVHGTLVGRSAEQHTLTGLIDRVRAGGSAVLVLRGEAGIGKTALLMDVRDRAADLRVIALSGAESEMELAYAGVQQLCAPLLGSLDRLPDPQKNALAVALGLRDGAAPDRLLVSLAVLSLLADAGTQRPTLCLIDDAQWVDRASLQALAFAGRRLSADPVGMIFAARDLQAEQELAALPHMHIDGLADADARALLSSMMPARLDDGVRDNILAEAAGNPLALLELNRALPRARMAGGYGLVAAKPLATRIEQTYGRRLRELPSQTRMLLLLAAAEPTGEPSWLWAAAARLGIGPDAGVPAEQSGLVSVDTRLRFRHPLVRSAVYRDAIPSERRQAHTALAEVISGPVADEHRAWHHAHAADAPSEAVAVELLQSADRARRRGGSAAAAAFLAYAVELTPDPVRRAERALAAALSKLDAGDPEAAARLLEAVGGADDELLSTRADLVRAKIAFATNRGSDAPPLLLAAAERLRDLDPALARETYLEALMAAAVVGRYDTAVAVAEAARNAPTMSGPPRAVDLLLDGTVVRLTDGYVAAAPLLKRAIDAYLDDDKNGTADPRWHLIALRVLLDRFEEATYNALSRRQLEILTATGELTALPNVLTTNAGACVNTGDFAQAVALIEQSRSISEATGTPPHRSVEAYLAAYRGQERVCVEMVQATIDEATERGEGAAIAQAHFAAAILRTGLRQYDKAFAACSSALEYDDIALRGYILVEMVEAAIRSGHRSAAETALDELAERAAASGSDSALGLAARCRALVDDGPTAEAEYDVAIANLQRSPVVVYYARTHLVYGEWLRRQNRRIDARRQLRIAHEMFTAMGADGFAERTRRELAAAGEPLPDERGGRSTGSSTVTLTTQESYIARLAGDGYSNSEIAGHLFISPRTVEWHLSKIFAKLGVSSRRELRQRPW
ncbi:transcriptional regulator [Mycobacterium sp. 852013-51886_SCH5428379]|uniref:helix-turn-helix transcriptional regulator n=1 Tax=Mycobacterium sp. 852013-51886_SCH5428379 TaxID=1834111 RepID=UPI0007FFDAB4|nr:LuxR family transcriptional regulator [Mycobacterium sp. 852013-51886_SCH5428379]OBB58079.1 transcriptional regulator [Mycobacterium sp. 852013-51886_SCH5428379]